MKKLFSLFIATLLVLGFTSCSMQNTINIAVVKYGTHTSLDEINTAIVDTLNLNGYNSERYNISEYNANFSIADANQIMQTIKSKADVVVAIATPVAQAAYNILDDDTPIVFAAVSDPIGAGLLNSLTSPSENVTGTSDEIQVDLIIDKALEINHSLKKIGFIYNPGEDNSVTNKNKIETYCAIKGIDVISSTIQNAGEMSEVASVLSKKVDAIFVTDDNTVASSMTILANICKEAKIPCYTGADSLVKDGGMLCVGINYTTLGNATAKMVIDILNGEEIQNIPVKIFNENLKIYLNTSYVKEASITIPDSILNDENLVEITDK